MRWNCRCECGAEGEVSSHTLRNGSSTSCGCFMREFQAARWKTHGKTGSKEYIVYRGMIKRCTNPNEPSYKNYGGRGIAVCQRWLDSFENFLDDMGERPNGKFSLNRLNNEGNYCKENCAWSSDIEQHNNTRCNRYITRDGVTKTIAEWCRELGLNRSTVYARLYWGVPEELAFSKEPLTGSNTNKRKKMQKDGTYIRGVRNLR